MKFWEYQPLQMFRLLLKVMFFQYFFETLNLFRVAPVRQTELTATFKIQNSPHKKLLLWQQKEKGQQVCLTTSHFSFCFNKMKF
jgi:hypothetical protein